MTLYKDNEDFFRDVIFTANMLAEEGKADLCHELRGAATLGDMSSDIFYAILRAVDSIFLRNDISGVTRKRLEGHRKTIGGIFPNIPSNSPE